MLKISKISKLEMFSDEWRDGRKGKFTSSEAFKLMCDQYVRYIRQKVGEIMWLHEKSSVFSPTEKEIDTEATRWGTFYEPEAIYKFGVKMSLQYLVTQKLITEPGSRFGSTPDGLIVKRISPDETEYEVETIEVKCPPISENYLLLFDCETPQQLKSAKKEYYWQVLDQMDNCESLIGHFVAYHPEFKSGNMRHIVFNAMQAEEKNGMKTFPIHNDLKALRKQKAQAVIDFDNLYNKLVAAGNV